MPEHWLHIYEKPVLGDAFITRTLATKYKHRLTAVGGSDKASATLALGRSEAEAYLATYLGNRVAVYVDNPVEPIFDGFISRMTLNAGALTFTRSLDAMYNRAAVTYSAPDVSGTAMQRTAVADNTDSQAIYGIKQGEIDAGYIRGTVVTRMTALRDGLARLRAWPQNSTTFNSQGGDNYVLQIEMLGWYHALEWVSYGGFNVASNITPDAWLTTVVLGNYPNTSFFDTTDTSLIETNSAFTQRQQENGQKTFWQHVQQVVEAGDGATRWVAGVTNTNANTGTRRLYYRPANDDTRYTVRSDDGRIRDAYGGIVDPWRVIPDARAAVGDVLDTDNSKLTDVSGSATPTASSQINASNLATNLNDNDLSSNWGSTTTDTSAWIQYQFSTPIVARYMTLTNYSVNTGGQRSNAPRAFTLSGSNTGAFAGEQTVLLAITATGNYWQTAAQETKYYTIGSSRAYNYYRIDMIETQAASFVNYSLAEWRLFDAVSGESRASFYIEAVDYDAEGQSVQLTSADDITTDGAFQFGTFYRAYGERFGAPPRSSDVP